MKVNLCMFFIRMWSRRQKVCPNLAALPRTKLPLYNTAKKEEGLAELDPMARLVFEHPLVKVH